MFGERTEFEKIVNSGEIGIIKLCGKYSISPWSLIYYCERTINNAIKLSSIINMCKLIISGIKTDDLAVEIYPKDLIQIIVDDRYNQEYNKKYTEQEHDLERKIIKAGEIDTLKKFWHLFSCQRRPNVLVRENNKWFPIYESNHRTAIQIRNITVESPPTISFEGLGSTINDIRFGKQREVQAQISWANQEIAQSAKNIYQILNSMEILNNPDIPQGFKMYAKEIYSRLIEKQKLLNDSIGIQNVHIDIKG
ncbi:MAG: hypothetical protein LBQ89_01925 [Treponema sp.]|jgi:hypothetical protein|nr:hypothetical protein [Treponema sp.]